MQSRAAESAADILCSLLDQCDFDLETRVRQDIIKACDGTAIQCLVELLRFGPIRDTSSRLLVALTEPRLFCTYSYDAQAAAACTALYEAGGLRHLVADLTTYSEYDANLEPLGLRSAAIIESLAHVACVAKPNYELWGEEDDRDLIRDAGAIPPIVALLTAKSVAANDYAAGALMHLMAGITDRCLCDGGGFTHRWRRGRNTANKKAIHAAGAIPLLVPLARHVFCKAAKALRILAANADFAAEIWSSVVPVLLSEDPRMCPRLLTDLEPTAMQHLEQAIAGHEIAQLQTTLDATMELWRACSRNTAVASGSGTMASCLSRARARIIELEAEDAQRKQLAALGLSNIPYPSDFCCPVTWSKFVDPVVASDGHTYERSAITDVIESGNGLSPLTREPL